MLGLKLNHVSKGSTGIVMATKPLNIVDILVKQHSSKCAAGDDIPQTRVILAN